MNPHGLTPEILRSSVLPQRGKTHYLPEHQQGLEVLEVPWGPGLEQKRRTFTGNASPVAFNVPPSPSHRPR